MYPMKIYTSKNLYMSKLQTYFHTILKAVLHPKYSVQAMLLLLVDQLLQHLHHDTQNPALMVT
jgi:hypothetical protein